MRKEKMSDAERREKWNAYQRQYKKRNPEKFREYNNTWIIRKAARLIDEQTAQTAGKGV